MIRTLLADDHPPTLVGVRAALSGHGFAVVAEARHARGAVEAARTERPELCVLDLKMPGGGIEAATEIGLALPDAAIVMLTVSASEEDLFAALRAGARGYLLKDTSPERLPFALMGVIRGEAALPRALVARVIREFRQCGRPRLVRRAEWNGVRLTQREWEVLGLLREGLSTAEIAAELEISAVTVRRHLQAVLQKLRVTNREAALQLLENFAPAA